MRNFILLLLIIVCLLTGALGNKVLVIQLVIPTECQPYLEWLLAFPGIESHQPLPQPESAPLIQIYEE